MKIDSIEDTLYFLAGLDVAHTSTVLSEGGTTGQAGTVISPTLNRLDATNWTDNQWFNFVCGLIKVAAGQTPPTPFPEYIEGYNFAIIPPDTVYARGTANEIVWTGVDEVILQVGTNTGSTVEYNTYKINLQQYTFEFMYSGEVQLPKEVLTHQGYFRQSNSWVWHELKGLTRIADYHYLSSRDGSYYNLRRGVAGSSGMQWSAITFSFSIGSNYSSVACVGKSLIFCTEGSTSPYYITNAYLFMTDSNGDIIQNEPYYSWAYYSRRNISLILTNRLVIDGYAYLITDIVSAGNNIVIYGTVNGVKRGYEFTNIDMSFGEDDNLGSVTPQGTFTGRVYDDADMIVSGSNHTLGLKKDSSQMLMVKPVVSTQNVTLAYKVQADSSGLVTRMETAAGLYNVVGSTTERSGNQLLTVRSVNGDSTWEFDVETQSLVYVGDGVPGDTILWNKEAHVVDSGVSYVADVISTASNTYGQWALCMPAVAMGPTFIRNYSVSNNTIVWGNIYKVIDNNVSYRYAGHGLISIGNYLYESSSGKLLEATDTGITITDTVYSPTLIVNNGTTSTPYVVSFITQTGNRYLVIAANGYAGECKAFEFTNLSITQAQSNKYWTGSFTGTVYDDPSGNRMVGEYLYGPNSVVQYVTVDEQAHIHKAALWRRGFRSASYIAAPSTASFNVTLQFD